MKKLIPLLTTVGITAGFVDVSTAEAQQRKKTVAASAANSKPPANRGAQRGVREGEQNAEAQEAASEWSTTEWLHDASGQVTLDIPSAIPPEGRVYVQFSQTTSIQGVAPRISIPCPLDEFGEQMRLWTKVTVEAGNRELQPGKEYNVTRAASDQGGSFLYIEIIPSESTNQRERNREQIFAIQMDSLLFTSSQEDEKAWNEKLKEIPFAQVPAQFDGKLAALAPAVPTHEAHPRLQQWKQVLERKAVARKPKNAIESLQAIVEGVNKSVRYQSPFENPTLGKTNPLCVLNGFGDCGVYGAGTTFACQELKNYGILVFSVAGFQEGSAHMKNGVVAHVQDPQTGSVKQVLFFADGTTGTLGPQGNNGYIVTAFSEHNTFDRTPASPLGYKPLAPRFLDGLNVSALEGGSVIQPLRATVKRVPALANVSFPFPQHVKNAIEQSANTLVSKRMQIDAAAQTQGQQAPQGNQGRGPRNQPKRR